ncbi:uncharacterized protein J3D65DRAFT_631646 [Phyllosticta citribraziliensis]|uniref:Secreted protein n=1 Tax=Phyllosticta citribraziliensis TaxID=989973 RepID=A0ABR1LF82_9PEZI
MLFFVLLLSAWPLAPPFNLRSLDNLWKQNRDTLVPFCGFLVDSYPASPPNPNVLRSSFAFRSKAQLSFYPMPPRSVQRLVSVFSTCFGLRHALHRLET